MGKEKKIAGACVVGLMVLVIVVAVGKIKEHRVYRFIAKGKIERVEYIPGSFSKSSKTVIYFDNGKTLVMIGHHSIPGKELLIYKQCCGKYEIKDVYRDEEN